MGEFEFVEAQRHRVPLRFLIGGPSGSGKTLTALKIAQALEGDKRTALIDTEHESASLYADAYKFQTLPLVPPFSPQRYREGVRAAIRAERFGALIIDSITHEWSGKGGVLEMVDVEKRSARNQYTAWAMPSREHNLFLDELVGCPLHLIATVREKTEYAMSKDKDGKTVIEKLGMGPIQREGAEYEFSIFAEMDLSNTLTITKSRYTTIPPGASWNKPGDEFIGLLVDAVQTGELLPEPVEDDGPPIHDISDADVVDRPALTLVAEDAPSEAEQMGGQPERAAPDEPEKPKPKRKTAAQKAAEEAAADPGKRIRPSDCGHPKSARRPAPRAGFTECSKCGSAWKGEGP